MRFRLGRDPSGTAGRASPSVPSVSPVGWRESMAVLERLHCKVVPSAPPAYYFVWATPFFHFFFSLISALVSPLQISFILYFLPFLFSSRLSFTNAEAFFLAFLSTCVSLCPFLMTLAVDIAYKSIPSPSSLSFTSFLSLRVPNFPPVSPSSSSIFHSLLSLLNFLHPSFGFELISFPPRPPPPSSLPAER